MPSNLSGIEDLVANLIHDLRQPLANLEGCSYYLSSLTKSGDARVQELAQVIERQVENAEQLLSAASLELSRTRGQRQEAAGSIDFTNAASAGVT
jgi:signal transduction histidine kinase